MIALWIDDPATTSVLLRQAIGDLDRCRALTPPLSEAIRVGYFEQKDGFAQPENWWKWGIDGPDGESHWHAHVTGFPEARRFLLREPERTQRVHRLIIAGLLAQSDRPRWARPKLFSEKLSIFEIDARTPPVVATITPQALAGWAERSEYAFLSFPFQDVISALDSEPAIFDNWRQRMAERAYEIDHGQPAKTYADLLGVYLKELPEGIEPGDPLGAPTVPN